MDEKTEGRSETQSPGSPVGQSAQPGQTPAAQGEASRAEKPAPATAEKSPDTPPAPSCQASPVASAEPPAASATVAESSPAEPPPSAPVPPPTEPAAPQAAPPATEPQAAPSQEGDEKPLPFFLPPIEYEIVEPPEGEEESDDGFERLHAGPTEEVRFDEDTPRRHGRRGRVRDRRHREEAPTEPVEAAPAAVPEKKKLPWGLIAAAAAAVAAAVLVIWMLTQGR